MKKTVIYAILMVCVLAITGCGSEEPQQEVSEVPDVDYAPDTALDELEYVEEPEEVLEDTFEEAPDANPIEESNPFESANPFE